MLTVCPYGGSPYDVWPDEAGGLVALGRNEVFDADFVTVVQQSFIHPSRYEDVDIARAAAACVTSSRSSGWTPTPTSRNATSPRRATVPRCPWSSCVGASRPRGRHRSICTATGRTKRAWTPTSATTGGTHCPRCSTAAWCARSASPAAAANWVDGGGSTAICGRSPTPSDDQAARRSPGSSAGGWAGSSAGGWAGSSAGGWAGSSSTALGS